MPKAKYKKRKDGRYLAQIPTGEYREDGKPKLKNIYARAQAELDLKIAEMRKQIETGLIIQDKNITVKNWAERWLTAYKGGLEHKTREMYQGAINKHIIPRLGPAKMRDIRQHHLQELINIKSTEKDENGNTLCGKRTLEVIRQTLKQIFAKAAEDHIIAIDPAANIKLPRKVTKPKITKRALTIKEDTLFLKLVDKHENGLFFKMLYYTGMRPEEARALVVQDIDYINNEINIDEAVIFENDSPVLKGCKTNSSIRKVPMPEPLKAALMAHRTPGSVLLFPGGSGSFMNKKEYERIYQSFDAALNELAGGKGKIRALEKFTPYILRHNFATMMADAGVPPQCLQYIMGHSSIDVTMKYYVHISERQKKIVDQKIKNWNLNNDESKERTMNKKSVTEI